MARGAQAVWLAAFLASLTTIIPSMASSQPQNPSRTVALEGHVAEWANPDNLVGPAPPLHVVRTSLHFGYTDPDGVKRLGEALSDPRHPLYGQYLTLQEFTARFAPSEAYVANVSAYFAATGVHVAYTAKNRKYIHLEATVDVMTRVLRTSFGIYEVAGIRVRGVQSEPRVPSALAQDVSLSFHGLDDRWHLARHVSSMGGGRVNGRRDGTRIRTGKPPFRNCYWKNATSHVYSTKLESCGYKPAQLRSAYSVPKRLTGRHQTVAILGLFTFPYMNSDLDRYSRTFGLPHRKVKEIDAPFVYNRTGTDSRVIKYTGDYVEEMLDVQAVRALAPRARIVRLAGSAFLHSGFLDAINYVLEYSIADIISVSYNRPLYNKMGLSKLMSADFMATETLLAQAVVLGVGAYFASGDTGDDSVNTFHYHNYDYGQTIEEFTALANGVGVGGTTLAIGRGGEWVEEYGWSQVRLDESVSPPKSTFIMTATGRPSRKKGRKPVVFWFLTGGTSLSTPLFAAMMALKQEQTGKRYGFPNPLFYSKPHAFRDIVEHPSFKIAYFPLTNHTYFASGRDTALVCTRGYDNVTGLGTPGPKFWKHL